MKDFHLLAISLLGIVSSNISLEAQKPKNVLYIMADDLNSDLGCFDDPMVKTPNLDILKTHSVRFNRAYSQYPLSGPSRACIFTGYYADQLNVYDNEDFFRKTKPSVVSLPQIFKQNGFFTARVGKIFHYGVPGDIGTDGQDDPLAWNIAYNPIGKDKTEEDKIINYTPTKGLGSALSFRAIDAMDNELTDGIIANVGSMLIDQNKDKPFFIAIGFFRPHTPYVAPNKYFDLYPLDSISLPYYPADDWKDKPVSAMYMTPLNWGVPPNKLKEIKRAYYASISFIDAQIGKLLDTLKKDSLLDNTVILFQSDHGYHLGQHGQWMKLTLFEQVAKAPLMISIPGITENELACDKVVELADIYPTFMDLLNLQSPNKLVGKSLMPLLHNPLGKWEGNAYTVLRRTWRLNTNYTYMKPYSKVVGRTIRTDRYRYTEWDEGEKGYELYDYEKDPNEFHNYYNDSRYKGIQLKLKVLLHSKYNNDEKDK